ncbi:MAG: hypothetical protein JSS16_13695 [Proteobacteria bacterium]|uniref:hypothetical protein n=1 Tax=Rudaea sp. TaxID=2136325 RepID=UPI001D56CF56|nr:hypothetical protein [Pseudomonadota bacterium]MBS0566477.1 hypothetical protein [Pseudomonadota bacterium]
MATINHHREGGNNVVQFRGRGARAQLREALDGRVPVRVMREKISPGWTHGYVIGMSTEFALIAEVSDAMRFDGFLAIALSDVSHVEEDPGREFVERALNLNEEALPALPEIDLADWQTIAQSAASVTPLISLNMLDDADAGEISYVGRLTGAEPDALVLQEVDPNANWYPDTGAYEFPAIGSIAFGTAYMLLLARIAGVPPVPLPPEALPAS